MRKYHLSVTVDQFLHDAIIKFRNDPKNKVKEPTGWEKPSKSQIVQNAIVQFLGKYVQKPDEAEQAGSTGPSEPSARTTIEESDPPADPNQNLNNESNPIMS